MPGKKPGGMIPKSRKPLKRRRRNGCRFPQAQPALEPAGHSEDTSPRRPYAFGLSRFVDRCYSKKTARGCSCDSGPGPRGQKILSRGLGKNSPSTGITRAAVHWAARVQKPISRRTKQKCTARDPGRKAQPEPCSALPRSKWSPMWRAPQKLIHML